MRIQAQTLVIEILKNLLKRFEKELRSEPASTYRMWINKDLAKLLVKTKHGEQIGHHLFLDDYDVDGLIKIILNEHSLVEALMNLWESQISVLTPKQFPPAEYVNLALERLGQESHYLAEKSAKDWDEYDLSNVLSVLRKSGLAHRVFQVRLESSLAQMADFGLKRELEQLQRISFNSEEDLHNACEDLSRTYSIKIEYHSEERLVLQPLF
jgi:hypothetical protein